MRTKVFSRRTAVVGLSAVLLGGAGLGGATAAATPNTAAPVAAVAASSTLHTGSRGPEVLAAQKRLNQLGYSLGAPNGTYGPRTRQAVMALQKVAGLPRTGVLGPRTAKALATGVRPKARTTRGHVIEVDKARQVLLVVDGGRVSTIYNVSTGTGKPFREHGKRGVAVTPSGTFRFWTQYRGGAGWQHGALGDMYRPMYFNKGIAVHGSKFDVGAYPSSHGCVRIHNGNMDELRATRAIYLKGQVTVY
ncbi:L,D-transpeptidase family protein [Arsenicicoccus dermatophilus]|uniref:L,D-transpeptidase family protein n=1 Tax=Arsenicicoccus dermatophilus TaxID=1076331 RepID=UPI001F4C6D91|nr:L,D-transpeptidase family protein [Arsenicicoccus dermatophilus]MCH8613667.1 L,D-transpeptidase family protein [Arsenicicoccus dermatophilus]